MWIADNWKDYTVIDTSSGEKLERWGKYTLIRPDPQVIWKTDKKNTLWRTADASYKRSRSGGGAWSDNKLPESWVINYRDLSFRIKPMGFKHTGLFPEQGQTGIGSPILLRTQTDLLRCSISSHTQAVQPLRRQRQAHR